MIVVVVRRQKPAVRAARRRRVRVRVLIVFIGCGVRANQRLFGVQDNTVIRVGAGNKPANRALPGGLGYRVVIIVIPNYVFSIRRPLTEGDMPKRGVPYRNIYDILDL